VFFGWAGEEFRGDVEYSANLVKRNFKRTQKIVFFGEILKRYWTSVVKIIKRFRERNIKS